MEDLFLNRLQPLYKSYNEMIKPLIAEIEVRFEKFPISVFNEIRAFNDHVARCYIRPDDCDAMELQISKAKGHIERIILDCYKFLNVSLYDSVIKNFDKRYKGVDLSTINNGDFQIQHKNLVKEIVLKLKEAKLRETQDDKRDSIALYQHVHNKYVELEELIDSNSRNLFWARGKFYTNTAGKVLAFIISAIISGMISAMVVPYGRIWTWLVNLF